MNAEQGDRIIALLTAILAEVERPRLAEEERERQAEAGRQHAAAEHARQVAEVEARQARQKAEFGEPERAFGGAGIDEETGLGRWRMPGIGGP